MSFQRTGLLEAASERMTLPLTKNFVKRNFALLPFAVNKNEVFPNSYPESLTLTHEHYRSAMRLTFSSN